ncbi:hypothetical protein KIL84_019124 [Mauremys mutica]|uniref:Uncharacterized protein n=1 Tax=Mauremys mutica TaxID=74926 RepID=A0A9D4BAD2_9SAUR|nr:hypothetical protein KIL84_019124 [Mauremys mutica]
MPINTKECKNVNSQGLDLHMTLCPYREVRDRKSYSTPISPLQGQPGYLGSRCGRVRDSVCLVSCMARGGEGGALTPPCPPVYPPVQVAGVSGWQFGAGIGQ